MIRRDAIAADGSPQWLLIEQVAHARLAGQLAEHWRWSPGAWLSSPISAAGRAQFLAAIFHHDDGWAAWDAAPLVDARRHRPLSFTEMPMAVSTALWNASIATAETIGPLATYMVAGHFLALAERHDSWRQGAADGQRAGEAFLLLAAERMARSATLWRAETARSSPSAAPPADGAGCDLDESLRWLQLFDALSLWLCCADRTEPQVFQLPSGVEARAAALPRPVSVTFTPLDGDRMQVEPWPFLVPDLRLETSAWVAPARAIATATLEIANTAPRRQIGWRFEPRA